MDIQQGVLGTHELPVIYSRGQSASAPYIAFRFVTPGYAIKVKSVTMSTGLVSVASTESLRIYTESLGKPLAPSSVESVPTTVNQSDTPYTFSFSDDHEWLPANTPFWGVLVPSNPSSISLNWKTVANRPEYQSGRASAVTSISDNLPNLDDLYFSLAYEFDADVDVPVGSPLFDPPKQLVWCGISDVSHYTQIPVYAPGAGGGQNINLIKRLADLRLPDLQEGDVVRVIARARGTNNESNNVNWVRQIRIEPNPGENWSPNIAPPGDPMYGNDEYMADGKVSWKQGENITPGQHHDADQFDVTWVVPQGTSGTYYAKLVSRAHANSATSGWVLKIETADTEIEAWVWR